MTKERGAIRWFADRILGNSYPQKMIPGIDIVVCTTATNDKDARLLLSSMGIPFHGKHVN